MTKQLPTETPLPNTGRLKAYLAAGTSVVATAMAAGSADAAVITSTGPTPFTHSGITPLDFNGDSVADFHFNDIVEESCGKFGVCVPVHWTGIFGASSGVTNAGMFETPIPGQVVSATSSYQSSITLYDNDNSVGRGTGHTAYLGLTFDLGSGPLFGWLSLITGNPHHQVNSWAYSDTGNAMIVGEFFEVSAPDPDPPPPPPGGEGVPGPHSLLLLAGGLAGIGAYRRKRQVAA